MILAIGNVFGRLLGSPLSREKNVNKSMLISAILAALALTACSDTAAPGGAGHDEVETVGASDYAADNLRDPAPEHIALARELLILTGPPDYTDRLSAMMASSALGRIATELRDISAEQRAEIVERASALADAQTDSLLNSMAQVYARIFTEDELRALIGMYRSEPAQKLVAVGDEVRDGVARAIQSEAILVESALLDEALAMQDATEELSQTRMEGE